MEKLYDDSGYGWCDLDKEDELVEHGGAARFLIVTDNTDKRNAAYVHFRFTLQGEAVGIPGSIIVAFCLYIMHSAQCAGFTGGAPSLYIMDIQLEPFVQRKGLGRHLMRTIEMIARKQVWFLYSLLQYVCHVVD